MPALVSGAYSSSPVFYNSYLTNYIERDVKFLSEAIDALKSVKATGENAENIFL